jgi:hypothetical protein
MRGYFPMSGIAGRGEEGFSSDVEGFDPTKVPVYPYYQVFRGVVTEVSHEYNAGNYTVSMSCSDFLHFWSNLKVATNGSLFGTRPDNSNVQVYLSGHRFTNCSPHSIIYSLFRIGFGSAGGVEFTMGRKTNIASVSDYSGETLSKMAGLNQERLFNSRNVNLRMYGMDGTLYNGFTQAYLGAFGSAENASVAEDALTTLSPTNDRDAFGNTQAMKLNSRLFGFNELSAIAAVGTSDPDNPATINVLQMAAFQNDVTQWGNVNQFETEYMTKLEIAQQVCEITGFEFYQDVDGDIVFKPAFYNMDTKDDPVYVIEDRDLISLTESDREPEATYIKGTGSHFQNFQGTGTEGWLGVAGMYADYRLIADFGWREETFECAYLTNAMAIYTSCMNRLDLVNAGRRSADISIPLRPELRPGYPVYIESVGAYYYIESMNHSFQFGGQCTTQITGPAKRAKFHAPGNSGSPITIDSIQLDNPYLPATPLATEGGDEGPPRYIGFPNVVLALDPEYLNSRTMLNIKNAGNFEQAFQAAISYGVIENVGPGGHSAPESDGPFAIRTSNELPTNTFDKSEISDQWEGVQEALLAGTLDEMLDTTLGQIIAEVQKRQPAPDQQDLINYLVLLNDVKARVAPGLSLTGQYRYYSCSHPEPNHQGQALINVDQETDADPIGAVPAVTDPRTVMMFSTTSQAAELVGGTPTSGIQVTALDAESSASVVTLQTSQIKYVTFARHEANARLTLIRLDNSAGYGYNLQVNKAMVDVLRVSLINGVGMDPSTSIASRFEDKYDEIFTEISTLADSLKIPPDAVTVSSQSEWTAWQAQYSSSQSIIQESTRNGRRSPDNAKYVDASKDTVEDFYGKTDQEGVKKAAGVLSVALYDFTVATFDKAQKMVKKNRRAAGDGTQAAGTFTPSASSTDPLYAARDVFINAISDGVPIIGTDGNLQVVTVAADSSAKQTMVSPVFPVSDADGYEVYGSFAYGRGITIASYAQLLQTAGPDGTVVVGTGDTTSLKTLTAIEAFLDALADGQTAEYALEAAEKIGGALARQDIERGIGIEGLVVSDGAIKRATPPTIDADDDSRQAKIAGSPISSQDRGQSYLAANAPQEIANIDPGTSEICQCKGAEAMFFLQAFSGEYASLESNEAVQTFLETEAQLRLIPWELSREAMAGQIMDSQYTSMGERFQKMGSDYSALFSEAGSGFAGVGEDITAIGTGFAEDVQATEDIFEDME